MSSPFSWCIRHHIPSSVSRTVVGTAATTSAWTPSLLEQDHPLHCMVNKGGHCLPWGTGAVQDPVCSTQLANIGDLLHFSVRAAHFSAHSPMHGSAASFQTQADTSAWWNTVLRAMVLPVGMEGTQGTHCDVSVPSGLESLCRGQAAGVGGCQLPVCMAMELWGCEEKRLEETSSLPTAGWVLGWEGALPGCRVCPTAHFCVLSTSLHVYWVKDQNR